MGTVTKEELKRTLNRVLENPKTVARVKIDGTFIDLDIVDVKYDKENNRVILKTK